MHYVVVLFHLHEVGGVSEARSLEQVPGVAPQRRHFAEFVAVALEVAVIDGIEARQGGEEPDVGLGDRITHEIPLAR
ncbi:hypothetical protein D3C85_1788010 [compost metagenome]